MRLTRLFCLFLTIALTIFSTTSTIAFTNDKQKNHSTDAQIHALNLKSINNLRDIGGYTTKDGQTTKWGLIYRSGDLSHLSSEDQNKLNTSGIKTIIDFRSADERTRAPSRWNSQAPQANIILLPIGGSAADWASEISQRLQAGGFTREEMNSTLIAMYRTVPIDNTAEYKALFEQIFVNTNQAILFHCTSGKDRTGIGAALILSALDVPRETIMQDYLLSNTTIDVEKMSRILAESFSKRSGSPIKPGAIVPILAVEASYLNATFTAIDDTYGSMDNYLREAMGLTDIKRAQLKKALLFRIKTEQ
jgi:protein-tyrosine phosphatase